MIGVPQSKKNYVIAGAIGFALMLGGAVFYGSTSLNLNKIHRTIEADHTDLEHIAAADFMKLNQADVIVFDVREADEYAVSHIDNAIQVDPNLSEDAFFARYGDRLKGKKAIFYCSVGRRSSRFLDRVDEGLAVAGADGGANLIGGIFKWRNQSRPLRQGTASTGDVHPYNAFWGKLIEDKDAIRYAPALSVPDARPPHVEEPSQND